MLVWPFRPNLVTNSLPPGPQVPPLLPSSAPSFLPACRTGSTCRTATRSRFTAFYWIMLFFQVLCSFRLPSYATSAAPPSPPSPPSRPELSSFLPLTASCSGSYHSRKCDSLSPVKPALTFTVLLFLLTIAALNGCSLALLAAHRGWGGGGMPQRGPPIMPPGPNLLMGLFIINNKALTSQPTEEQ